MQKSKGLLITLIVLFVIIAILGIVMLFFYLQPRETTIKVIYEKDTTEPVLMGSISYEVEDSEERDECGPCYYYSWRWNYCYNPCEDPCADPCHYPNYYMYDSKYYYKYDYWYPHYPFDTKYIICHKNYYNCGDFRRQKDAQRVFDFCWDEGYGDIHHLDEDDDYRACEWLD